MITKTLKILGTHCPSCQKLTERRIGNIAGVATIQVDYETGKAELVSEREITKEELQNSLEGTDYKIL